MQTYISSFLLGKELVSKGKITASPHLISFILLGNKVHAARQQLNTGNNGKPQLHLVSHVCFFGQQSPFLGGNKSHPLVWSCILGNKNRKKGTSQKKNQKKTENTFF